MRLRTGCDIVHIPRFRLSLERTPELRARMFTADELADRSVDSLAGMFAAKEAVCKALDLPAGDWHALEILPTATGRPELRLAGRVPGVRSADISISHDGEYAFAVATFTLD